MLVDRILKIIELKNINKNRFYKETGLSNGFLDKVKDIGASKIEQILNVYPEINPEWLLTGKGDMIKPEFVAYSKIEDATAGYRKFEEITSGYSKVAEEFKLPDKLIPLVSVKAIGGNGNDVFAFSQQDVKERYRIPKFDHKKVDFMIEVEGASMYPKYNSGDVVACTIIKESNFMQWHKVHVVATREQGIIIKRIEPSDQTDHLRMVSDNEKYKPFDVPTTEITGIALVVGVIRLE